MILGEGESWHSGSPFHFAKAAYQLRMLADMDDVARDPAAMVHRHERLPQKLTSASALPPIVSVSASTNETPESRSAQVGGVTIPRPL